MGDGLNCVTSPAAWHVEPLVSAPLSSSTGAPAGAGEMEATLQPVMPPPMMTACARSRMPRLQSRHRSSYRARLDARDAREEHTWATSLASLRTGGRIVLLGNTTGDQVSFSLSYVYRRGLRLLGAGSYSPADFAYMLDAYFTGGLRVVRGADTRWPT